MKVCGNPSNSCPDISLKTTNVNMVALEEKSEVHQSIYCLGTIDISTKVCANPCSLVDVDIFHWISKNFDLLVALEEKFCEHLNGSPSSSCWDILVWTKAVDGLTNRPILLFPQKSQIRKRFKEIPPPIITAHIYLSKPPFRPHNLVWHVELHRLRRIGH